MRLAKPRIAPLTEAEWTDEQRKELEPVYRAGQLYNVVGTLARHWEAYKKFLVWGRCWAGMTLYDMSKAKEVLRFFREFSCGCPDELSTEAAFLTGPDGTRVVAIVVCYCGAVAEGAKVLEPLRTFGSPIADLIQPITYVEMQRLFDEGVPPGRWHYWKSNFVRALSDDAIEMLVEYATTKPSPTSFVNLQQMHDVASRVSSTETAFAHRYEQYNFEIVSNWADPADSEKNVKWTRAFWEAMQPFVEQSVSVNHLGRGGGRGRQGGLRGEL